MDQPRPPAVPPLPTDPAPVGTARVAPTAVPPQPESTLPARIVEPSPTLAAPGPGSATLPGPPQIAPESRQLPPHQTKLERVTGHVAALSEDLREWVELRIDLVKRQIEGITGIVERFQHYLDAAKYLVPAAVLALTAVFFLLVTVALGIGELIGSNALGFLITTVLMLVAAAVFGWLGLRSVRRAEEQAAEARRMERDQQDLSRDDIAARQRKAARRAAV